MGTMCGTHFKTNDLSIVDVIKTGLISDFEYDNKTGIGFFYVKNGLANLNLDKIVELAKEHKSSFRFDCMGDYYFPHYQILEFKDGVEILSESRHEPFEWEEATDDLESEFFS